MKCRIVYRKDGGILVIYPVLKSKRENETEQEWLDRVFAKSNPEKLPFKDVEKTNLPEELEQKYPRLLTIDECLAK